MDGKFYCFGGLGGLAFFNPTYSDIIIQAQYKFCVDGKVEMKKKRAIMSG